MLVTGITVLQNLALLAEGYKSKIQTPLAQVIYLSYMAYRDWIGMAQRS